jgi:hypothetical protein
VRSISQLCRANLPRVATSFGVMFSLMISPI